MDVNPVDELVYRILKEVSILEHEFGPDMSHHAAEGLRRFCKDVKLAMAILTTLDRRSPEIAPPSRMSFDTYSLN